jgi:hypothetical protein
VFTETPSWWWSSDRIRTCGIRFRNDSSAAGCLWRLMYCFALIAGGRIRGHFASASRFAGTSLEDRAAITVLSCAKFGVRVLGDR